MDFMGGDLRVDQAAGASLNKIERYRSVEAIEKIIRYMMKHRHGTPFEHSVFTFRVKAPIFVTREWMRHRMGSYNELSLRYTEISPEFYVPDQWRKPDPDNKQSSIPTDWGDEVSAPLVYANTEALQSYLTLLNMNVSREQARMVLPVNTYTEFVWTVNARALMNFLSLRLGEDAQWEIRQYAVAILDVFEQKMPITMGAFVDNGYTSP